MSLISEKQTQLTHQRPKLQPSYDGLRLAASARPRYSFN